MVPPELPPVVLPLVVLPLVVVLLPVVLPLVVVLLPVVLPLVVVLLPVVLPLVVVLLPVVLPLVVVLLPVVLPLVVVLLPVVLLVSVFPPPFDPLDCPLLPGLVDGGVVGVGTGSGVSATLGATNRAGPDDARKSFGASEELFSPAIISADAPTPATTKPAKTSRYCANAVPRSSTRNALNIISGSQMPPLPASSAHRPFIDINI